MYEFIPIATKLKHPRKIEKRAYFKVSVSLNLPAIVIHDNLVKVFVKQRIHILRDKPIYPEGLCRITKEKLELTKRSSR